MAAAAAPAPAHAVKEKLERKPAKIGIAIFGVALLLVWAGFVEAFLSQYHEPVMPYSVKIAFGLVELVLLSLFLAKSGGRDLALTQRRQDEETQRRDARK